MKFGGESIEQKDCHATLVVCPVDILRQWYHELQRHSDLRVLQYYGIGSNLSSHDLQQFDVVITSFQVLAGEVNYLSPAGRSGLRNKKKYTKPVTPLMELRWWRVVVDEAQIVCNNTGSAAEMVNRLQCVNRWCVTGTPITGNGLEDVFGLLTFLQYRPYNEHMWWLRALRRPYEAQDENGRRRMYDLLKSVMWRYAKRHVEAEIDLPPNETILVPLNFSAHEQRHYDRKLASCQDVVARLIFSKRLSLEMPKVMTLILQLRQICSHPEVMKSKKKTKKHTPLTMEELKKQLKLDPAFSGNVQSLLQSILENIKEASIQECPVCLESCDEPFLTPCGHLFCKTCLFASFQANLAGQMSTRCAICRSSVLEKEVIDVSQYAQEKEEKNLPAPNDEKSEIEMQIADLVEGDYGTKINRLVRDLKVLQTEDPAAKCLVFSQWNPFLDIIAKALKANKISFCRLTGDSETRAAAIEDFNQDPNIQVFLLNMKTGSTGLTLVAASHVFIMEPPWNAALQKQAVNRIFRIGQTKPTFVHLYSVCNTIEEKVSQMHQKREQLSSSKSKSDSKDEVHDISDSKAEAKEESKEHDVEHINEHDRHVAKPVREARLGEADIISLFDLKLNNKDNR
eukprot:TRINITY_DN10365_c0_g1_i4.p1 TRINITY_DN10365_c0_g1~~TRINITY_DN10365_c0_g1_i4.p1  ORF type:complete len:668 (+),score=136.83 TRINITY_DN10365_c0_g1_i4:132-2006(+)